MAWNRKWMPLLAGALVVAAAFATWLYSGHDENYELQRLFFSRRFALYDDLIVQSASRYGVPPELVKAVIWRESRFQPLMRGAHGERGLMQITEGAASDWAKSEKIETFVPADLFDAKTNIEAGTWYLSKALKHWSSRDDPVPFALAEYNAGRTHVKRWARSAGGDEGMGAAELQEVMDFPGTRRYIADIVARYRAFLADEEFPGDAPGPR